MPRPSQRLQAQPKPTLRGRCVTTGRSLSLCETRGALASCTYTQRGAGDGSITGVANTHVRHRRRPHRATHRHTIGTCACD